MPARSEYDPITTNAVTFMRSERQRRRWSAQLLSDLCDEYGAVHEPPIPNSLSRSRIAKLESGRAATLGIDEAYLLAGAFGVGLEVILAGGPDSADLVPGVVDATRVLPHGHLLDRVRTLERQMAGLIDTLGQLGIRGLPVIGDPDA